LFFKSVPEKVVGPGEAVGIRAMLNGAFRTELAFVINAGGKIVGFTIGNDMSSRDIEGETYCICRKQDFMKDHVLSDGYRGGCD